MPAPGHRSRAIAAGQTWFFTGEPCLRGHITERLTSDGSCRECKRIKSYAAFLANKQKYRDSVKRWYAANPERAKENARRSRKNRGEAHRERERAWRAKNADRIAAYKRRDDPETRARNAARVKAWALANPEKHRANIHCSKRRRKGATGRHTGDDVVEIRKLQKRKCAYCRAKLGDSYHVDHIMPLKRGGSNDRRNIQLLCAGCNMAKSAKHPADFARQRGFLI